MKRLVFLILSASVYLCCIYYTINYFTWNFIFEGYLVGSVFASGFALLISTAVAVKTIGTAKSIVIFFAIFIFSILFVPISKQIGNKHAEYKIANIKKAIEKYYEEHKSYPEKIIYLTKEGYVNGFNRPFFLIPSGKYIYTPQKDLRGYGLSLEAKYGDYGVSVSSYDNSFNYYDY